MAGATDAAETPPPPCAAQPPPESLPRPCTRRLGFVWVEPEVEDGPEEGQVRVSGARFDAAEDDEDAAAAAPAEEDRAG